MPRVAKRVLGAGVTGDWLNPDEFTRSSGYIPLKDMLELLSLGCFVRNQFAGGTFEIDASAAGTFDLPGWVPIEIDNTNGQLTGFSDPYGATMVIQFRMLVYVSNVAISATPVIYDITGASVATTTGAAACSAVEADFTNPVFTGTDQQQILTLTPPNAAHVFKPQLTIAGTPAAGYRAKGIAVYDCYINS